MGELGRRRNEDFELWRRKKNRKWKEKGVGGLPKVIRRNEEGSVWFQLLFHGLM